MGTIPDTRSISKLASWRETVAGILPVLTLSLATSIEGTSSQSFLAYLPVYFFILLLYALPAIGIPMAVKRGIPRWSSSYLGLLLVDIMLLPIIFSFLTGTASGGVWTFGLVAIPLLSGGFLVLKNLLSKDDKTEKRTENDWTQILFGIQTLIPIYLLIVFDEIDAAYKSPFIILNGLILAAGAMVYLRSRHRWLGSAALLSSILLVVLLAKNIAGMYWSTHPWG